MKRRGRESKEYSDLFTIGGFPIPPTMVACFSVPNGQTSIIQIMYYKSIRNRQNSGVKLENFWFWFTNPKQPLFSFIFWQFSCGLMGSLIELGRPTATCRGNINLKILTELWVKFNRFCKLRGCWTGEAGLRIGSDFGFFAKNIDQKNQRISQNYQMIIGWPKFQHSFSPLVNGIGIGRSAVSGWKLHSPADTFLNRGLNKTEYCGYTGLDVFQRTKNQSPVFRNYWGKHLKGWPVKWPPPLNVKLRSRN